LGYRRRIDMKEYVFALMFVATGCGGSGDGSVTPPSPISGPGTGLGDDGSQPGGDQTECKSMVCASPDQARSVVDPSKLVKRCGEGQVMVEDICAKPRALVTEDGGIEFGNIAKKEFVYRTDIMGRPETPLYVRKFVSPGAGQEDFTFSYYIKGDEDSTVRWNQPGLILYDHRFNPSSQELYFAVPGFYDNFDDMSLDVWGNSWGKTESAGTFEDAKSFCAAIIQRYKELFLKDEGRFTSSQLPGFFNGEMRYGCRASDPLSDSLTGVSIGFVCKDSRECFVKNISLYKRS
jgi:hypothetical protein